MKLNLVHEAKSLPTKERQRIIEAIPEPEFHHYLAELFRAMSPEYWVEVTHKSSELGKDLVILRNDPLSPDVMAVVVKRGDIRAKTAGDVDTIKHQVDKILTAKGEKNVAEILSQIFQSTHHPAELKGKIESLEVTKVFVVLVGGISESVRKRFLIEVGPAGNVFDQEWLVRHFTEYYPQIFFEGRATDFLDDLVHQLEQDTFYQKTNRTLSDCFVEPIIERDARITVDQSSLVAKLRQKRIRFAEFGETVIGQGRVLLIGDPGSGKSKAVAKVCIDTYRALLSASLRQSAPKHRQIPLLTTARKIFQTDSPEQLLDSLLPSELREAFSMSILIVDGLDEVQPQDRPTVLDRASAFAEALNAALLVTSRNVAAVQSAPAGFTRYDIAPFQIGQAMRLVEKVLTDFTALPILRDGVERIKRQLPMNPLSLLLLIELVAVRGEVPSSITELFDRFIDLATGRYDKEKGIDVLFEYLVKKRFLAALAYEEFFLKRRLEIPSEDFEGFLSIYATRYRWDEEKLKTFAKELERAGILLLHAEVLFRHRSFLDYFVALYLFDNRESIENLADEVVNMYFGGLWTEVAFFFVGLRRELPASLLERILGFKGTEFPIEKLLSGRLLQAGWASTTDVKEHGIRSIVRYAPGATDAARVYFAKIQESASPLFHLLFTALFAEQSLGSVVLQDEVRLVLQDLEGRLSPDEADLTERIALLWASRRSLTGEQLDERMREFIKAVRQADLPPLSESKYLFMATLADSSNVKLQHAVTRRLRTLVKMQPSIFPKLIPGAKVPFRPPKQ